jgi:hypothetical protein
MFDPKMNIDHDAIRERIASVDTYWERQPTDQPHTLNGFRGTWNFSDHSLIPESLQNFIMLSFPKAEKFRRIPLSDINALMNDVWEGPGSMVKVKALEKELKIARWQMLDGGVKDTSDQKTIDDYNESDFSPSIDIESQD